jgi:hypothetical protein
LKIARQNRWLQDIALDNLTLGRAHFALALARQSRYEPRAAIVKLDESVEALRTAGANHYLPRGLLARAAFRRAIGDWDGAKRDLCEAKEIAESGLMRLYWCDCALERARLALARREAFAPLSALVERSPRRRSCLIPTPRRRSKRKREGSSTSPANSSPNAATTGATRSSPSSTPSLPAPASSRTCRRVSEARRRHRLGVLFRPAVGADATSQILGSGSRRVSDPQSPDVVRRLHLNQGERRRNCLRKS